MMSREDQSEPTEDEDEFYYSLNRRSVEKQDASFTAVGVGAIAGAFLFAPVGIFAGILMFITIPLCALTGALLCAGAVVGWNEFATRYLSRDDD